MIRIKLVLSCLTIAQIVAAAEKPSFNCKKAKSTAEIAICGNPRLSRLDRELSAAYKDSPDSIEEQRAWLLSRKGCEGLKSGDIEKCLEKSYRYRFRQLVFSQAAELPDRTADHDDAESQVDARMKYLAELSPEKNGAKKLEESELACEYLEEDPKHAIAALRSHYGSTKDSFFPMCGVSIEKRVPTAKDWLNIVDEMNGNESCAGTMRFGTGRDNQLTKALVILAPTFNSKGELSPDPADEQDLPRQRGGARGKEFLLKESSPEAFYIPDLQHWSEQGIYERNLYKKYRAKYDETKNGLVEYYKDHFKFTKEKAERTAQLNMKRLEASHFDNHSGQTSVNSYPSLVYESQDVDEFLKHGTIPIKYCEYCKYADGTRASTLRRLLGIAIVTGNSLTAIEKILKAGANLEPVTSGKFLHTRDDSPMMMAADRTDVIKLLLKYGASSNYQNAFGKTPLMYAVQENNISGVQELLKAGAKVDVLTIEEHGCGLLAGHRSALMYAAWKSSPEMIALLLSAGADRNAQDTENHSAYDYLEKNSRLSKDDLSKMKVKLATAKAERKDSQEKGP